MKLYPIPNKPVTPCLGTCKTPIGCTCKTKSNITSSIIGLYKAKMENE
ncbi:MAG: hypothetical protein RL662_1869 [Bacteroidota bacterium]